MEGFLSWAKAPQNLNLAWRNANLFRGFSEGPREWRFVGLQIHVSSFAWV